MATRTPAGTTTTAFTIQSALSFGISLVAVLWAAAHLAGNGWMRGFLFLGVLYVVTSSFTLSKCIRDQQEASSVISRVDQVRLERLLAEYDPFGVPAALSPVEPGAARPAAQATGPAHRAETGRRA
jgi:hypothetical protein